MKEFIEFPKLGIHLDVNPVVFSIPGTFINVHWYGIIIAAAIMIALTLAIRQSKKFDIKEDDLIDMFLIALPVSIVFARLFFVVFTWNSFKNDLLGIFRIWEGGLAIYGAIIGAVLSVYIFSRVKKINMLDLCDFACVYLPLAQSIGRWGNFTNQELYGSVTNLPWGMTGSIIGKDPVHPTFLYESLLNLIVFAILLRLRKNRKVKGSVFAAYLMLYSFIRFMMEFLRTDKFGIGNVRYNQVFAVLVFIGALIWMIYLTRNSRKAALEAEEAGPSAYADILNDMKQAEEAQDSDPADASAASSQEIEKDGQPEADESGDVSDEAADDVVPADSAANENEENQGQD